MAADFELFHTSAGEPYCVLPFHDHSETHPIRSTHVSQFMRRRFHSRLNHVPGTQAIQDAKGVLEGQAIFDGKQDDVFVRVAGDEQTVYLDLCDEKWRVVEIDAQGWRVVDSAPLRFRRARGMLPLPVPMDNGDLMELQPLLRLSDKNWLLVAGWLIGTINPRGPYPILDLSGEHGTGKSTLARMLRSLIDPNLADIRAEPRDVRDLVIAANNSWSLVLDNISHIPNWLSDALCRISTGGGFSTRLLWADGEEALFNVKRPVLVTGIDDIVTRSDLLDRSLLVELDPIAKGDRRTESKLWAEFETRRPYIVGALCSAISLAIHNLPETNLKEQPRMADFCQWVCAAQSMLSSDEDGFLTAFLENRASVHQIAIDSSMVAGRFMDWWSIQIKPEFEDTPTILFDQLSAFAGNPSSDKWPKSARGLSSALRRVAPNLRALGIDIQFPKSGGVRKIKIRGDANSIPGTQTGTQNAFDIDPVNAP